MYLSDSFRLTDPMLRHIAIYICRLQETTFVPAPHPSLQTSKTHPTVALHEFAIWSFFVTPRLHRRSRLRVPVVEAPLSVPSSVWAHRNPETASHCLRPKTHGLQPKLVPVIKRRSLPSFCVPQSTVPTLVAGNSTHR